MDTVHAARRAFERLASRPPDQVAFAPGRVNLVGEHTDYNDGFVLPMAIDEGIAAAFAPRTDRLLRVQASEVRQTREIDLAALPHAKSSVSGWFRYVAGVAWAMQAAGEPLAGADIALAANLPTGAGLSSSAALELAIARVLSAVGGAAVGPAGGGAGLAARRARVRGRRLRHHGPDGGRVRACGAGAAARLPHPRRPRRGPASRCPDRHHAQRRAPRAGDERVQRSTRVLRARRRRGARAGARRARPARRRRLAARTRARADGRDDVPARRARRGRECPSRCAGAGAGGRRPRRRGARHERVAREPARPLRRLVRGARHAGRDRRTRSRAAMGRASPAPGSAAARSRWSSTTRSSGSASRCHAPTTRRRRCARRSSSAAPRPECGW